MMKKNLSRIIIFIAYIILLFPYIASIPFSIPTNDDFSMAAMLPFASKIASAIDRATYLYVNFGGGIWIAKFFEVLLSPLVSFPIDSMAYGITMFVFFFLLMNVLNIFFRSLFRYEFEVKNAYHREILIWLCMAIPLVGFNYSQVLYWFSGAPYAWFLGLSLLTCHYIIKYSHFNERKSFYMLILCGAISSMNIPYTVPVILFYIMMMLKHKKEELCSVKGIIPIFISVCGAFVYLLSPGVHARQEYVGNRGVSTLLYAVILTVKGCLVRIHSIVVNCPCSIILLFVILLFGIWNRRKRSLWAIFIMLITGILSIIGSLYPVMVGYGVLDMPNRVCFVFDYLFFITMIITIYALGQYLGHAYDLNLDKSKWIVAGIGFIFCIYILFIGGNLYKNSCWTQTVANLENIKTEHDTWISVLREIDESSEEEVVVKCNRIVRTDIIMPPDIGEDETYWVNAAAARFFGKKSIRIEWEEIYD